MSDSEFLRNSFIDDKDISTTMVLSSDVNRPVVYCKAILKKPLLTASAWKMFHHIATLDDCFSFSDVRVGGPGNDRMRSNRADRGGSGKRDEAAAKHARGKLNGNKHSRYYAKKQVREYIIHKARQQNLTPCPVATVHSDKLLFETLSRDQSTYCRIDYSEAVMDLVETPKAGTTHFSYSRGLDKGFNKVRDYKQTFLVVDPGSDDIEPVESGDAAERSSPSELEQRLWHRKMLIFNSASVRASNHFRLDAMDIYNLIVMMKRYAKTTHCSGLMFRLRPQQPVVIVLDPWGEELRCPNSIYHGEESFELKMWGRDRFKVFESFFAYMTTLEVFFDDEQSPMFFVTDVEGVRISVGFSNTVLGDWSRIEAYDFLSTQSEIKGVTRIRILKELQEQVSATVDQLCSALKLSQALVTEALHTYIQAGRVIYDLIDKTYRIRDLDVEPIAIERIHYLNQQEARARVLVEQKNAVLDSVEEQEQYSQVGGSVTDNAIVYQPDLIFDREQRLIDANCFCKHYAKHKLTQGPCAHIMAVQILFSQNKELAPIEV